MSTQRRFRVLVFPCGSEAGLEIARSLTPLKDIELWGASSVADHGRFCFDRYIEGLPFVTAGDFFEQFNALLREHAIDFVYPAMDIVILKLAERLDELACPVVMGSAETSIMACSKRLTYETLEGHVCVPKMYEQSAVREDDFPLFLKPDQGCGSQGIQRVDDRHELDYHAGSREGRLILEYLPGPEFTVDCFTDLHGELRFVGPRERRRIARGISVNTVPVEDREGVFKRLAERINAKLAMNGAWFFQLKEAAEGELCLLEVAPRIAGSMGLQRCRGVNLPLLSVYNAAGLEVEIVPNAYEIEFDRAFGNRVRLSKTFSTLYLDFDDCLLLEDRYLNPDMLRLIAQFRNRACSVELVTRHAGDLEARLEALGIRGLLDVVHHLRNGEPKSSVMSDSAGVLVDDSHRERKDAIAHGLVALGPDAIEALF